MSHSIEGPLGTSEDALWFPSKGFPGSPLRCPGTQLLQPDFRTGSWPPTSCQPARTSLLLREKSNMNMWQSQGKGVLPKMLSDLDLHKCTGFQRSDREGRRLRRKAAERGVRKHGNRWKYRTFLKARQRFPPSFMSFCKNYWQVGLRHSRS